MPRAQASRVVTWLGRLAMMLAGIVVGLGVAEAVFWHRDGGAFPHLNVYRADPVLGVRLMPGATQKLAFGGNPITSVRINAAGYRGADWPSPNNEVLVVGDSQVFGLGVEEDQTFAARLGARLGGKATVINAGVPTYGPGEYKAVIAEQLATRHPKTVVVALNMVNDLFEASHPNLTRHAVWDGWAVRKETAPAEVTSFPGRELLFRRSHLFFALRRWWHKDDAIDDRGFTSEGTWQDLVTAGHETSVQRDSAFAAAATQRARADELARQLDHEDGTIDGALRHIEDGMSRHDLTIAEAAAHASPGDIVFEGSPFAESSRSLMMTAQLIAAGASQRAQLRAKLAAWAKAHPVDPDAPAVLAALDHRTAVLAQLGGANAQRLEAALDPPLASYVRELKAMCDAAGARLVVVILPIDVQVSAAEWAKYNAKPIDMTPSKILIDELAEVTAKLGVSVLDTTPALAAVEPGAFLDKDIHMTPRGHQAVADALAATLAAPPPAIPVASTRSLVPLPAVYREAAEADVAGAAAAQCSAKLVREWLLVLCGQTGYDEDGGGQPHVPAAITITRDDGNEAMPLVMPATMSLLVPLVPGRELVAALEWNDYVRPLTVHWPAGASKPELAIGAKSKRAHPVAAQLQLPRGGLEFPGAEVAGDPFRSPAERELCACWVGAYGGSPTCSGAYGVADLGCVHAYADRCARMLACSVRDPASPPAKPGAP